MGVNSPAACSPPVSSNARWAARSRSGSARMTERETTGPFGQRLGAEGDLVDRGLAADPARCGGHEMALGHLRIVERPRQADHDRVVGLAQRAGIAAARAEHLLALEQPLGPQEPDGELRLVARRAHGDRHRDRILARSGGADLERRLADDPVVADLERLATDGHDPSARHVPNGRDRVAGQVGHDVPSRAATNVSNAARAVSAASSATPRAGRPASPPPDADQSMNRVGGRPVGVEHGRGGAVSRGVAVGRWVVAQPVALDIDEIEDVDRGGLDGVGVLRLGGRRERGVQALDRRSVLVEAGEEFGPGEERRPARARRSGRGRRRGGRSRGRCNETRGRRRGRRAESRSAVAPARRRRAWTHVRNARGTPRPSVATSNATATTATTAPAMSQRDWGMSP